MAIISGSKTATAKQERTEWVRPSGVQEEAPCLQVRRIADGNIVVASSEDPAFTVVTSAQVFARFVAAVRAGEYEQFVR